MRRFVLPWPPKALSPNQRLHWSKVSKAKSDYRAACGRTAKEQGAQKLDAGSLSVHLVFFPPDRRRRDRDNMLASMKSGLDGLADVLGVDDYLWSLSLEVSPEVKGCVWVEVSCVDEALAFIGATA
jgi:crossover junction endodeoxyribonuclease RusA